MRLSSPLHHLCTSQPERGKVRAKKITVAIKQLIKSILLLLALLAPSASMAQIPYSYTWPNQVQPRKYNPNPGYQQKQNGQTIIYQNYQPKVCRNSGGRTYCD
jgi:hypothetical protein